MILREGERVRALVYGDVDLNLIDGSAIWAQGMVQALQAAGVEVTLVLKAPVRTGRLVEPLERLAGVTVRRRPEDATTSLSVEEAAGLLTELDAERPYDLVVVRGKRLAVRLTATPLAGRLWTYLTDVPQTVAELDGRTRGELAAVAKASRFLLCQTEELRCHLEGVLHKAAGKCVLFPPVVALPEGLEPSADKTPGRPLRLVYTGKFAPRWNTYEMTGLPRRLAARRIDAELHMIGDKIHHDRKDPGFSRRMRVALESTPGLTWHGGHPRAEAMRVSAGCDVGLSWRHPELDASLELSTKVLEMGALGLPVVLNRTPMHENLLGADYPLFAATEEDVVDVLADVTDPEVYALARRRCLDAARSFTLDAAAERLRTYLRQAFPPPLRADGAGRTTRIVVAGHDLKFFTRLLDHIGALPDVEVRVDRWPALGTHDPEVSAELAEWADVIICEWCGPNAVWYSEWRKKHGRPDQRLIVRLHRFELYGAWPGRLDIDLIDQVVCVSPSYAELTRKMTGWPAEKITVIPNWVDVAQFHRAKLPGAQFHLGMIGIAPWRKRLDLAVDVLEELRRHDPRFTLFVKSKLPWDLPWIWNRTEEREAFEALFRRIRRSPLLARSVVFDPAGPDVAAWLRRIGFVLSTSDDESFHLAPAEGMASGAVPALLPWPGADTIYDRRWIHESPSTMARDLAAMVAEGRWNDERAQAHAEVARSYALDLVGEAWVELLRPSSAAAAARTPTTYPAQAPSA
ncbi:glycosyltransferase [Actinoallomurus rhizosphaericola]|uniref:glycosyltransferase n=1 Tax=Actinoallomurus rhizosphaericola TaxID=2952536 RepID=UPI0020937D7D|nr:glycosyltransferase [Actinoallomurus rhizosphaericola]MCO5998702.1 glycosyltransferase [Actinoallomurus rhizosphaericola]